MAVSVDWLASMNRCLMWTKVTRFVCVVGRESSGARRNRRRQARGSIGAQQPSGNGKESHSAENGRGKAIRAFREPGGGLCVVARSTGSSLMGV